jgi:hypothetical protein
VGWKILSYSNYKHEEQLQQCSNYGEINDAKEVETRLARVKEELSYSYYMSNDSNNKPLVDFFIAGFPKCGTTSLLEAFRSHAEAVVGEEEFCEMRNKTLPRENLLNLLESEMESINHTAPPGSRTLRGIKCPMSIRDIHAIQRIASISPHVKLIIGIRHPIWFFQSFYNYRISYMYLENEENIDFKIPPPACLLDVPWREVSADLVRYELSLQQLNKTKLTASQLQQLKKKGMTVLPQNSIRVFLYSMEQLGDSNHERSLAFRKDLQVFLNLTLPILGKFPAENKLSDLFTIKRQQKFHPPQHLDICSSDHAKLRFILS